MGHSQTVSKCSDKKIQTNQPKINRVEWNLTKLSGQECDVPRLKN